MLWKPSLLFIDLDLSDFKSQKALDLALKKTLKNIKDSLNGSPTMYGLEMDIMSYNQLNAL